MNRVLLCNLRRAQGCTEIHLSNGVFSRKSEEGVTAQEVFPYCRDLINILNYSLACRETAECGTRGCTYHRMNGQTPMHVFLVARETCVLTAAPHQSS